MRYDIDGTMSGGRGGGGMGEGGGDSMRNDAKITVVAHCGKPSDPAEVSATVRWLRPLVLRRIGVLILISAGGVGGQGCP